MGRKTINISHGSSYTISEHPKNKLLEEVSSLDKIKDMSSGSASDLGARRPHRKLSDINCYQVKYFYHATVVTIKI